MIDQTLLLRLLMLLERFCEVSIPISFHDVFLKQRSFGRARLVHSRQLALVCDAVTSLLLWNKDTALQFSCIIITSCLIIGTSLLYEGTASERFFSCVVGGIFLLLVDSILLYALASLFACKPVDIFHIPSILPFFTLCEFMLGNLIRIAVIHWKRRQRFTLPFLVVSVFYPLVSIVINALLLFYNRNTDTPAYLIGISVGLLLSLSAHFLMMTMLSDQTAQSEQAHLQAAVEQERAEALMESYTTQRRLTHEFSNHLDSLYFMLEQGDVAEAKKYLSKLNKSVASATAVVNTHNPLLDSILSRKYEEAAAKGVTLYFDLTDLRDLTLEKTDLVIVVSNLLNNAIEAAAQTDQPEIHVRIKRSADEYILSVRNRVRENVEIPEGGLPHSTKKEPGHGMGLANVRDVLARYGAEYTLSCRENWFRFTCAVPTCKL